ncbi:MAG: hypothetical protein ACQUHE_09220 [Bacteroidia bacterium]
MIFEKQYNLGSFFVDFSIQPGLIRIQGSEELLVFLSKDLNKHTLMLVRSIKADYLAEIGKPLKVTNSSLMVEIWGHLYASKFAIIAQELIKLKVVKDMTQFVIQRSDTIDCGETELDSNRKFWDMLSKFKTVIVKLL